MVAICCHARRSGVYAALGVALLFTACTPLQISNPIKQTNITYQLAQCAARFEHDFLVLSNNPAWVEAVATVALAVIAFATVRLNFEQNKTNRAQLRAYIFIEDAKITAPIERPDWIVEYTVKNAGVTPAHKVTVVDVLTVTDWRPAQLPTPVDEDYFGSMAPNGDFIDQETDPLTVTREDNLKITAKDNPSRAIFLVGKISYLDVFRRKQTTHFCFYWQGPIGPEKIQMSAYDDGNDST